MGYTHTTSYIYLLCSCATDCRQWLLVALYCAWSSYEQGFMLTTILIGFTITMLTFSRLPFLFLGGFRVECGNYIVCAYFVCSDSLSDCLLVLYCFLLVCLSVRIVPVQCLIGENKRENTSMLVLLSCLRACINTACYAYRILLVNYNEIFRFARLTRTCH